MSDAALIGVDWGTSNRRAWLFDRAGSIVAARRDDHGMGNRCGPDFATDLAMMVGDWPAVTTILSGMIGSRGGWQEVDYVRCPAGAPDIAAGLKPVADRTDTFIVPGLAVSGAWADVLRGEETQILGLAASRAEAALVVMPGTHSKWLRIAGGRVETFRTFPTGELYAAILDHTVIGAFADCREINPGGFTRGLDAAAQDAGVLAALFAARAGVLLGAMAPADCASYLSGLLIATELNEGLSLFGPADSWLLVGSERLTAGYRTAFERAGIAASCEGEETAARGLWRLATEAGLVG